MRLSRPAPRAQAPPSSIEPPYRTMNTNVITCDWFPEARHVCPMSDPYPVTEVQPDRILDAEEMGTKTKFWYLSREDQKARWLFKYPREGTGEHWAEKIAAEVASLLGIAHAKVELARFQGKRGSVTESFVRPGEELHHGNQVLERVVRDYDSGKKFHQASHTLENIWRAIDDVFREPDARSARARIAEYLVLDALIGNTDRHHENWGICVSVGDLRKNRVAPSFDHASSLGRELLDARRDRHLVENRVGNYVEKGHGAIYWSGDGRHGPSPLELARRAARRYPDLFRPALAKLEGLDESAMNDLVDRVPACWMTPSSREFAVALMRYGIEQLKGLVR